MSLDIHDLLEVYRIAIRTDKGIPLVHRRTALEMFGKARRHWRQDHPDAAQADISRYDEIYRMCISFSDPAWRAAEPQSSYGPDGSTAQKDIPAIPPGWRVTSKRRIKPGDPEYPPDDYSPEDGPIPEYRIYLRRSDE